MNFLEIVYDKGITGFFIWESTKSNYTPSVPLLMQHQASLGPAIKLVDA